MLLRLPGVYSPDADTELLIDAITEHPPAPGARALDVGTGTGRVALALKSVGASTVEAIDISLRAVLAARLNAAMHRLPIRVRRGDLLSHADGLFDLIVANPPYVPSGTERPGAHSRARAWDAGHDGRSLLDRLCEAAPRHLRPNGAVLLVHSALCDPDRTVAALTDNGLRAAVILEQEIPFGPVLRSRAEWLEQQGLVSPGQRTERIVVVRGEKHG
ncbi:MAG TPA: HemK2/MTQ2 family protein methyltransferase [Sporichthyaceae bacterium]|jgi:release factor glutamine methyltransferase